MRKLASAVPTGQLPVHLTSAYRFSDRTIVVLPTEALSLDAVRMRFSHEPLSARARVHLDSLFLYFHHEQAAFEISTSSAVGDVEAQVRVSSARSGPVEVRCHWLGSSGRLVSSSPITIAFE